MLLLVFQLGIAFQGIGNYWQWGHNGFNSAAYQQAARNSLRWGNLFPAQYTTGNIQPNTSALYTHAPLGLHLQTTATVAVLGDSEASVRLVPALNSVFAFMMLFFLVRRHWGDGYALVATALYGLMPINTGFANMSNHTTGCFFWGLAGLYCYLEWVSREHHSSESTSFESRWARWRAQGWHWCVGLFFAFGVALNWDWPGYFVSFIVALHWLYVSFDDNHKALTHKWGLNKEHLLLAAFSAFVLLNFIGFFWLAYNTVGSFDEITASINLRARTPVNAYVRLWQKTLAPMFSAPLLMLGALWIAFRLLQHAQRKPIAADLIIIAYGFAGLIYTVLFKSTALVHIYWPWQFNIYLALASTGLIFSLANGLLRHLSRTSLRPHKRRLASAFLAVLVATLLGGFFSFAGPLVPEGRRMAGTFNHVNYNSEQLKILFCQKVASWTSFDTGVAMLKSFRYRIEALATLDRVTATVSRPDRFRSPKNVTPSEGWVIIGPVKGTSRRQILNAAAKHPFRQFGLYFMVDTRTEGQDIQIWNLIPDHDPPLLWRFWNSSHEPKFRPERDSKAEAAMRSEIAKMQDHSSPAIKNKITKPSAQ